MLTEKQIKSIAEYWNCDPEIYDAKFFDKLYVEFIEKEPLIKKKGLLSRYKDFIEAEHELFLEYEVKKDDKEAIKQANKRFWKRMSRTVDDVNFYFCVKYFYNEIFEDDDLLGIFFLKKYYPPLPPVCLECKTPLPHGAKYCERCGRFCGDDLPSPITERQGIIKEVEDNGWNFKEKRTSPSSKRQETIKEKEFEVKEYDYFIKIAQTLHDSGDRFYVKGNYGKAVAAWTQAISTYDLALQEEVLSTDEDAIKEEQQILNQNICQAYIKNGERYGSEAEYFYEEKRVEEAKNSWENAKKYFEMAIEHITSNSLDIPFENVKLKINLIDTYLTQEIYHQK